MSKKTETSLRLTDFVMLCFDGNKSRFAEAIGITRQAVDHYFTKGVEPRRKTLDKFESVGLNSLWLLSGTGDMFANNEAGSRLRQIHGSVQKIHTEIQYTPSAGEKNTAGAQSGTAFATQENKSQPLQQTEQSMILGTLDPKRGLRTPLVLSPVRAGRPSWASSDVDMWVDMSKYHHENSFYVVAVGDSMVGAGIEEGMRLLVDEQLEPRDGDIVVAEINGEYTVKRLKRNGKEWLLHPENADYERVAVDDGVKILGVVTKAERMYR